MLTFTTFLDQYLVIIKLALILLSPLLSPLLERKLKLINKIKRLVSKAKNEEAQVRISIEYKTDSGFNDVVSAFKTLFREERDFNVSSVSSSKMEFFYDIYSIEVIQNQRGNLFIEVGRIGCGIRDMKKKITKLLMKLDTLTTSSGNTSRIFTEFVTSEVSLSLPYKWENFEFIKSKDFKLKGYNIKLSDREYKTEVDITLDKINFKPTTREAIIPAIEKFL